MASWHPYRDAVTQAASRATREIVRSVIVPCKQDEEGGLRSFVIRTAPRSLRYMMDTARGGPGHVLVEFARAGEFAT